MRQLADKSYCLECSWYEQLRDRLPIPQPRLFWSGAESPADPSKDLGVYGVLIEWLGDDLKKVDLKDGVTEEETVQAMTTLARLHAAWWNTEEEEALSALFKPEESLQMILGFMGGAELAAELGAEPRQLCVVHNAAQMPKDSALALSAQTLRDSLELNVVAPAEMNRLLFPRMGAGSSVCSATTAV